MNKGCGKLFPICWDGNEYLEIKCNEEFSGKKRLCPKCVNDAKDGKR